MPSAFSSNYVFSVALWKGTTTRERYLVSHMRQAVFAREALRTGDLIYAREAASSARTWLALARKELQP